MTLFLVALPPALAQAPATAPSNGAPSILPMIFFMAVICYFVIFRPQQKKAKEQAALISSLKTGDQVVTSGGFHGMISNVKDTTVIVKFAENVKIEVDKASVTGVIKDPAPADAKSLPAVP